MTIDPYLQHEVEIVKRTQDSSDIFTLWLRFTDPKVNEEYCFLPGQFNMLYLYGVGEVAISIVSDPEEHGMYAHTIRAVGRTTRGLAQLKEGDRLGVRGSFGNCWPVEEAKGKDVIVVTGGLGCAPVVAAINYMFSHRENYNKIKVLQGVRHIDDFIYRDRYAKWEKQPETEVIISADNGGVNWPFSTGFVTESIKDLDVDPNNTITMMCGPEGMMRVASKAAIEKGLSEDSIYLSMERNMHCGIGHCGHCQFGSEFICKDGPIFTYAEIKDLLSQKGF